MVKTSNFILSEKLNKPYAIYYGNYVYFDTTNNTEEMIKCDAYEIRLYTEKWFRDAIVASKKIINDVEYETKPVINIFYPDITVGGNKFTNMVMVMRIEKFSQKKMYLRKKWFSFIKTIIKEFKRYPDYYKEIDDKMESIGKQEKIDEDIYNELAEIVKDMEKENINEPERKSIYRRIKRIKL